ncbi:MAG TPA: SDR family NAD(P)-dependent oxidoreductase [Candidatus Binatia bacterium]
MLLQGKVAVVTGSGRGIGRGIALALAREGAAVVVNDVGASLDGRGSDQDPAAQVCREIEGFGGRAVPNYDSVSDYKAAKNIIQTALDTFGRIDILVNNAGIVRDRSIMKMTEEDFDAVIAVHLKGSFNCGSHAIPHMREQGFGRIINITSSAGLRGNFGQTNYSAAKAALMGITFTWSIELAKYGITVNALAPSGMTRMVSSMPGMESRPVSPEMNPDLNGPLVAFLASDRAAHVNGQIFGRRGYAFTIFQTPRPIASMYKEGGFTAQEIADQFDASLGEHLQQIGIPQTRRDTSGGAGAKK